MDTVENKDELSAEVTNAIVHCIDQWMVEHIIKGKQPLIISAVATVGIIEALASLVRSQEAYIQARNKGPGPVTREDIDTSKEYPTAKRLREYNLEAAKQMYE